MALYLSDIFKHILCKVKPNRGAYRRGGQRDESGEYWQGGGNVAVQAHVTTPNSWRNFQSPYLRFSPMPWRLAEVRDWMRRKESATECIRLPVTQRKWRWR